MFTRTNVIVFNIIWTVTSPLFIIPGITLLIMGLVFAFFISEWFSLGGASILISFGIAIIALGISRRSEEITSDIAKSSFFETIGVFEDRRLGIRERYEKIQQKIVIFQNYRRNSRQYQMDRLDYTLYYSYSIWKCWTYLDRAMIFKKYFTEDNEKKLIHSIDCLFQDLCTGKQNLGISLIGVGNYIGNLISMYDTISHFNRYDRDTVHDQLRRERIFTNLEYLNDLAATPIYGF